MIHLHSPPPGLPWPHHMPSLPDLTYGVHPRPPSDVPLAFLGVRAVLTMTLCYSGRAGRRGRAPMFLRLQNKAGLSGFWLAKAETRSKKKNHRIIAFMCSAWLPPALCHLTPCGRLFACPSFVVSLFCSPSSGRICHSILCHRSLLSSSRLPHGSIILGQFYPVLGNLLHPPISMNPSIPGAVLLLSS